MFDYVKQLSNVNWLEVERERGRAWISLDSSALTASCVRWAKEGDNGARRSGMICFARRKFRKSFVYGNFSSLLMYEVFMVRKPCIRRMVCK